MPRPDPVRRSLPDAVCRRAAHPGPQLGRTLGLGQCGDQNLAFSIRDYRGQIVIGPVQFYIEPLLMKLRHQGDRPLDLQLWACSFYDSKPDVQTGDGAHVSFAGCAAVSSKLTASPIDDTGDPGTLEKLAVALDDLRELGALDLRLNHGGR